MDSMTNRNWLPKILSDLSCSILFLSASKGLHNLHYCTGGVKRAVFTFAVYLSRATISLRRHAIVSDLHYLRTRNQSALFDIDIEHCPNCGGSLKIIAAIEDPPVIVRILTHLGLPTRAPPRAPAQRVDLFQTI